MDLIALRDYLRNVIGRLATSGWRPYVGWGGGFLCYQLIYFAAVTVPREHLTVDGQFYWFVVAIVSLYVSTFITRGVEKHMERQAQAQSPSHTGGLVNQAAIT